MRAGEERLCGKCESKTFTEEAESGVCIACQMGEGFQCERAIDLTRNIF